MWEKLFKIHFHLGYCNTHSVIIHQIYDSEAQQKWLLVLTVTWGIGRMCNFIRLESSLRYSVEQRELQFWLSCASAQTLPEHKAHHAHKKINMTSV